MEQQPTAPEHHSVKVRPSAKQQPKPPGKGKTIAILVAPILGFVFLVGIIGIANNRDSSQAARQTQPAITPTPMSQALLDVSGSGSKTTRKFTAARGWDLHWSYDCTSSRGPQPHFVFLVINNNDASILADNQPTNQRGTKGSGLEHYHTGGTFYVAIDTGCSWHVTVKG